MSLPNTKTKAKLNRSVVFQKWDFLEMKGQDVSDIKSTKWILDLAFVVDITKHFNELNLNIPEKNKIITCS
jgi:hypothetical protein